MEDMDKNSDDAPEVGGENEEVGMASTVANVSGIDIGISEDTGGGGDTVNDDADKDAGTSEDADDGGDMVNEGAEEDAEEDAEEEVLIETYATVGTGSDTDGNEGADAGVESNGSGGDSRGVATCGPLAGDAVTSQHQMNAIPGLHISRLLRHLLSICEKGILEDTPASRRTYVCKYFSLCGAIIAVQHVQKEYIDDDVIEIEFASAAFLKKALKKEIAPGVIPARVVPVISPSTATATVKVLGVPPEASIQSLHEALVHHGTIQSAQLLPTVSGTGFIGFVTFLSSASGKAALEASYGFLGKEHIHIVHLL